MDALLRFLPARPQPFWTRYGASTIIVLLWFILRLGVGDRAGEYGFILLIPGVVLSSILFDRGTGLWATALNLFLSAAVLQWDSEWDRHIAALVVFGLVSVVLVVISEGLRAALERITRAEREKDLLFQEFRHRVRNNFALVDSLLSLQARAQKEPDIKEALEAAKARIKVVYNAHEYLDIDRQQGQVEMKQYLEELGTDLGAALRGVRPVAVRVVAEPIYLPTDRAVAIGIIVNELVTNAFKYAFPDDRAGAVTISLGRNAQGVELRVADNGVGYQLSETGGLGSRLVRLFAQQFGGTVDRQEVEQGASFVITLPKA
jgi:two-component sensor histidine kinase